jgi:hypothetical protein
MQKKLFGFDLKLILLFIPVAYISYLFHEFGHWSIGEILGNDMAYSLNWVWPKNGQYISSEQGLYVRMGGPAFSILQALIALIVIEKFKTLYAYPFLFFPFFSRFFSLVFGGFSKQDEASISASLGIGAYTVAIMVLVILILLVWRGSNKFKFGFKEISFFFLISTLCMLLIIGTYTIYDGIIK